MSYTLQRPTFILAEGPQSSADMYWGHKDLSMTNVLLFLPLILDPTRWIEAGTCVSWTPILCAVRRVTLKSKVLLQFHIPCCSRNIYFSYITYILIIEAQDAWAYQSGLLLQYQRNQKQLRHLVKFWNSCNSMQHTRHNRMQINTTWFTCSKFWMVALFLYSSMAYNVPFQCHRPLLIRGVPQTL